MAITFKVEQVEGTRDGSGLVKLDVYAMDGETVVAHRDVTVPSEAASLTADSVKLATDLEKLVLANAPADFDKAALGAIVEANERARLAAEKLSVAMAVATAKVAVEVG